MSDADAFEEYAARRGVRLMPTQRAAAEALLDATRPYRLILGQRAAGTSTLLALLEDYWKAEPCTGVAASWCPTHGDCTCPKNDEGEPLEVSLPGLVSFAGYPAWSETASVVRIHDPYCPLHSPDSEHGDDVETFEGTDLREARPAADLRVRSAE